MDTNRSRYIFDSLYGVIYFPDFIWDIITSPELQRLREIRLCNINSLCLTGGANINRFEHAIGTCFLAQECLDSWPPLDPINEKERKNFLLSALLHDIASGAFGHSFEYIESRSGFDHEKAFKYIAKGEEGEEYRYKQISFENIFFGMQGTLSKKIGPQDLDMIGELISGKGRFGPLINSIMDLDNIDNVFRLGYHIGIVRSGRTPLELARSLFIKYNRLILRNDAVPLVKEWYEVRRKLYSLLLLNREEFSGKCMLTEAIEASKIKDPNYFNWKEVDYELLKTLHHASLIRIPIKHQLFSIERRFRDELLDKSLTQDIKKIFEAQNIIIRESNIVISEGRMLIKDRNTEYEIIECEKNLVIYKLNETWINVSEIVERLIKGDLYGCITILSSNRIDKESELMDFKYRMNLEHGINQIIRENFFKLVRSFEKGNNLQDSSETVRLEKPDLNLEEFFGYQGFNRKKFIAKYGKFKSAMVILHPIIDKNKTERQVSLLTDKGKAVSIGTPSHRILIGVFFKNTELNMNFMSRLPNRILYWLRQEILKYLSDALDDEDLSEVEPCAELKLKNFLTSDKLEGGRN